MTSRTVAGVVWNYAHNTEGKLTVARKNNQLVSEYGYDGDGNRVARLGENNKGTIFIGNYFESSYPSYSIPDPPPPAVEGGDNTDVLSDISYYYAGGQRIAMRIGNEPYLLFGDHLGSTSVVMDASGQIVEKGYYMTWGGTRGDETITSTNYGYTGQMREGDIYYYGARWPKVPEAKLKGFDPAIGRFMQADSIVPLRTDRYE